MLPYEVKNPFRMNPEEETLLRSGEGLETGMVVLAEDPNIRKERPELQEWMFVSSVLFDGPRVSFVATYADGHQRIIRASVEASWYVKIHSVPA